MSCNINKKHEPVGSCCGVESRCTVCIPFKGKLISDLFTLMSQYEENFEQLFTLEWGLERKPNKTLVNSLKEAGQLCSHTLDKQQPLNSNWKLSVRRRRFGFPWTFLVIPFPLFLLNIPFKSAKKAKVWPAVVTFKTQRFCFFF